MRIAEPVQIKVPQSLLTIPLPAVNAGRDMFLMQIPLGPAHSVLPLAVLTVLEVMSLSA